MGNELGHCRKGKIEKRKNAWIVRIDPTISEHLIFNNYQKQNPVSKNICQENKDSPMLYETKNQKNIHLII